jgi:hypothetical protein
VSDEEPAPKPKYRGWADPNHPLHKPGYGGPAKPNKLIPSRPPEEFQEILHAPRDKAKKPWNSRKAELAEKAIGVFEKVIDNPEEPSQNKIVAADKLLNRVVETLDDRSDLQRMSDAELARAIDTLRTRLGGSIAADGNGGSEAPDGTEIGRVSPIH